MRFFTYILRFVLISIGFIAALLSASGFLVLMLWGGIGQGDVEHQQLGSLLLGIGIPLLALFAAYYAFLPAIIVFLFSEIAGKRSWLFHALSGILIALAAIARRADANSFANPPQGIIMAVIAAGAVGGTAYWLIAGRTAGKHIDDIVATSQSEES
jgi:hypothetical protein